MNRMMLVCALTLAACGSEAALTEPPPATPIPETTSPRDVPLETFTVVTGLVESVEIAAPPAVASVQSTPDRGTQIQVTETLPPPPPPSAAQVCNSMEYFAYAHGADQSAAICYRAVAAEQGWSADKIAAWQPFLITNFTGVIQGESSSCWNLRGGDRIVSGQNCLNVQRTSSPSDDTGWGQATRSLWGRDAQLCKIFGVCSWQQIIESPYSSMLNSVIRVVDLNGSQPWCWVAWARDYHDCHTAPDR